MKNNNIPTQTTLSDTLSNIATIPGNALTSVSIAELMSALHNQFPNLHCSSNIHSITSLLQKDKTTSRVAIPANFASFIINEIQTLIVDVESPTNIFPKKVNRRYMSKKELKAITNSTIQEHAINEIKRNQEDYIHVASEQKTQLTPHDIIDANLYVNHIDIFRNHHYTNFILNGFKNDKTIITYRKCDEPKIFELLLAAIQYQTLFQFTANDNQSIEISLVIPDFLLSEQANASKTDDAYIYMKRISSPFSLSNKQFSLSDISKLAISLAHQFISDPSQTPLHTDDTSQFSIIYRALYNEMKKSPKYLTQQFEHIIKQFTLKYTPFSVPVSAPNDPTKIQFKTDFVLTDDAKLETILAYFTLAYEYSYFTLPLFNQQFQPSKQIIHLNKSHSVIIETMKDFDLENERNIHKVISTTFTNNYSNFINPNQQYETKIITTSIMLNYQIHRNYTIALEHKQLEELIQSPEMIEFANI